MVDGMELPPDRYSFYRELAAKRAQTPGEPENLLPERVGLQPYITIEVYERLVVLSANTGAPARSSQPDFAEANAIFYPMVGALCRRRLQSHAHHHSSQWMGWAESKRYTTANTVHWKMEGIFVAATLSNCNSPIWCPLSRDAD